MKEPEYEKFKREHPTADFLLRSWCLVLIGLFVGALIASASKPEPKVVTKEVKVPTEKIVTKTVTKEVTPQACKDALDLDNTMFMKTGEALGSFDVDSMNALTEYITNITARRTALYAECISK